MRYVTETTVPATLQEKVLELVLTYLANPDYVISVWAVIAMKDLVEDFSVQRKIFFPYLQQIVATIISVVSRNPESSTNCEILHVITVIIEELQPQVCKKEKISILIPSNIFFFCEFSRFRHNLNMVPFSNSFPTCGWKLRTNISHIR